ncbi:MAG TPA: SDR family oxidoreductase [Myxococcales bacterium]|jgi:short-subunit dehydrogenase|nr:SDR family oxidoreductase [Myxococcales bacterium]
MNVVITGASAGIGEALADELGKRGDKLVLAARRMDKLQEVAGRGSALAVKCDVTKRNDVFQLFNKSVEHLGHIDAWVNNAGRGIFKTFENVTDEDLDVMIRDNVKSALYGMQTVLPHFKQRGEGVIVNVSSGLSRMPYAAFRSVYSASKAAVNSLTETLRLELAAKYPKIRLLTIMPGPVATDFGNSAVGGGPDSRSLPGAQSPEEVAQVITAALSRRNGDVYTRPEQPEKILGYLNDLSRA